MEKDVNRIPKNVDTDIIIRIDDFGGKRGITIREFVRGERYTGFTKAGTRIPAEHFKIFKEAINSIDEKELMQGLEQLKKESNMNIPKKSAGTSAGVKAKSKVVEEPKMNTD